MRTLVALLALCTAACTNNGLIDFAMAGASRPASTAGLRVGGREVLAGDMHCHVLPPDADYHVSRQLPETLELARAEHLDFVVLTPHMPARFYADAESRAWVVASEAQLRASIASLAPSLVVVPGFEYTDYAYGHVGVAFANLDEVLAEVSIDAAIARPELFFERWVAHGGLLTINHPLLRPLAVAPVRELHADLSWRGFSPAVLPAEIAWITAHAQSLETYNLSVSQLRDRLFVGDEDRSLHDVSHLLDDTIRTQRRRIAPVGGTDSHGHWLRANTFVVADARTPAAIRDAIVQGRTCVRGPEACTLEARAPGGPWRGVGEALGPTDVVEARASMGAVTLLASGAAPRRAEAGEVVRIEVPRDRCTLVRAIVGDSWSAPIYANCAFASL